MASNSVTADRSSEGPAELRAPRIDEIVARRLRRNGYPQMRNIRCLYRGGTLTLRGCLPTYYLKQLAQAAVADIDSVEAITNEIEVVTPAPSATCRSGSI